MYDLMFEPKYLAMCQRSQTQLMQTQFICTTKRNIKIGVFDKNLFK